MTANSDLLPVINAAPLTDVVELSPDTVKYSEFPPSIYPGHLFPILPFFYPFHPTLNPALVSRSAVSILNPTVNCQNYCYKRDS